jgi:hypothetical protein
VRISDHGRDPVGRIPAGQALSSAVTGYSIGDRREMAGSVAVLRAFEQQRRVPLVAAGV